MSKNWSDLNLDLLKAPRTVDEAVDRLLLVLSFEGRLSIATLRQDELIDLHFSLGMAVRNAFDLHEPGNKLLAAWGTSIHPDGVSPVFITALWRRLQKTNA